LRVVVASPPRFALMMAHTSRMLRRRCVLISYESNNGLPSRMPLPTTTGRSRDKSSVLSTICNERSFIAFSACRVEEAASYGMDSRSAGRRMGRRAFCKAAAGFLSKSFFIEMTFFNHGCKNGIIAERWQCHAMTTLRFVILAQAFRVPCKFFRSPSTTTRALARVGLEYP
jgi:hypothetical protein